MKTCTFVVFTFLHIVSSGVHGCKLIETPNLYRYKLLSDFGIAIGNPVSGSIKITVKARNDAHIALMSSNSEQSPLYEIVLGGWSNSKSVIRDRKQGKALATHVGRVLNENSYRTFFIKWNNGRITVQNGRKQRIVEWTDVSNPLRIKNIGVSTGWGATGVWRISC